MKFVIRFRCLTLQLYNVHVLSCETKTIRKVDFSLEIKPLEAASTYMSGISNSSGLTSWSKSHPLLVWSDPIKWTNHAGLLRPRAIRLLCVCVCVVPLMSCRLVERELMLLDQGPSKWSGS